MSVSFRINSHGICSSQEMWLQNMLSNAWHDHFFFFKERLEKSEPERLHLDSKAKLPSLPLPVTHHFLTAALVSGAAAILQCETLQEPLPSPSPQLIRVHQLSKASSPASPCLGAVVDVSPVCSWCARRCVVWGSEQRTCLCCQGASKPGCRRKPTPGKEAQ